MCGIAGIVDLSDHPQLERVRVERMVQAMRHRGPDHQNVYESGPVLLGHARLSIIDLSPSSNQPFIDAETGLVVVFNGEIYNYLELRSELEGLGHRFRTHSDTEVLVKAFAEWGPEAFPRFIGMWALCLYQPQARKVWISRDRFGIKPFYFTQQDHRLIFASELRALFASGLVARRPSGVAISAFLAEGAVDEGDETFFEGVLRLPPGSWAEIRLDEAPSPLAPHRFWSLDAIHPDDHTSHEEAVSLFRAALGDAVRLHLRSDVPLASCLSGGVDSSSLVSVAASQLNGNSQNRRVFTASFPGQPQDETGFAALVAQRHHMQHTAIPLSFANLEEEMDVALRCQEEPVGSMGVFVQWKVFQAIGKECLKVVLDGQGPDEYLGGYFSFFIPRAMDALVAFHPWQAVKPFIHFLRHRAAETPWGRLPLLARRFLSDGRQVESSWTLPEHRNLSRQTLMPVPSFEGTRFRRALHAYLFRRSLPSLLRYEDKSSMHFSLESRVPFLDHRLVELAFRFPERSLLEGGQTKRVLRDAVRGLVPDDVLDRKDKFGFNHPQQEWIDQVVRPKLKAELLGPSAEGLLQAHRLRAHLATPGKGLSAGESWRLFSLLRWGREHFG